MPTVNSYAKKDGLYIRAAQGGRMATYQVTDEGRRVLQGAGLGSGGEISPGDLRAMQERGLIYTGGSGAGTIDRPEAPPTPVVRTSSAPSRSTYSSSAPRYSSTASTYGSYSAPSSPRPVVRASTVPSSSDTSEVYRSSDEGLPVLAIIFGGIAGACCLLLILVFFAQFILWTALLFLPFGLMSGFLASSKGRSTTEGLLWGLLTGPVGVIVITFLSNGEAAPRPDSTKDFLERSTDVETQQIGGDTLKVMWGSLAGILIIALLFALVIAFANAQRDRQGVGADLSSPSTTVGAADA